MFSILSLFTEDVKLRNEASDYGFPRTSAQGTSGRSSQNDTEKSYMGSPRTHFANIHGDSEDQSAGPKPIADLKDIPAVSLLPSPIGTGRIKSSSVHPGIVARANIDTTIAVIPAEVRTSSYFLYTF